MKRYIAILMGIIFLSSCGKEGNGQTDEIPGQDSGTITVKVTPDRKTNFRNPINGWVLYAGMGTALDGFWDMYKDFPSSIGPVDVWEYSNTVLMRGVWSDLNPAEGVYVWQESNNSPEAKAFKAVVEGAKQRGMRIAFGFGVDSRDKHLFATPLYVRDKGAAGFYTMTGSMEVWSPFIDDPVFQQCYERFIKDFAAEFNDRTVVDFLGGVGLGKWGEYHNCMYSTGDDTPKMAVFNWVTNLYAKYFTEVPVALNYHRTLGTGASTGMEYADESAMMVQQAIDKGFILGSGAFGMHGAYGTWEKGITSRYLYKAPIIAEGGWVKGIHEGSYQGDGYSNWGEVRAGEFADSQTAHANTMDFRYSKDARNGKGDTWSWFNEAYDLVERYIQEGVYRLYPDIVKVPVEAEIGKKVSIYHRWRNLGLAYCPTNIKAWEGVYKVAFALLDPVSLEPVAMVYDETAHPHDWVKDSVKEYNLVTDMSWARRGKYIWSVGIVDSTRDNIIGINLAVKEPNLLPNGWVRLGEVVIR